MVIWGLSLLLLTGCIANEGAGTLSMAQENIWNLSRIEVGMTEAEVLKIMHCPQKKQILEVEGQSYYVWFYITKPTVLSQKRLVRQNVTPLTFKKGVLQGWGYELYDHVVRSTQKIDNGQIPEIHEDQTLQKEIEGLEEPKEKKRRRSIIMTKNENEVGPDEEESEDWKKKRKNNGIDKEGQEMIDEEQDQNFNFW